MIRPHPLMYHVLSLVFLCITVLLVYLGFATHWPVLVRAILLNFSPFSFLLALSYFWLRIQDEQGT